jgi:hypothetical protein
MDVGLAKSMRMDDCCLAKNAGIAYKGFLSSV